MSSSCICVSLLSETHLSGYDALHSGFPLHHRARFHLIHMHMCCRAQVDATGAVIQPIVQARPAPMRRQRRPNRIRPYDHSVQAACDSELAAAFLHAIQKKLYHMCTRKHEGRACRVLVGVCPQVCAKDLFAVMTARLHAFVCNDAEDKRSHVTYTVTLTHCRGGRRLRSCARSICAGTTRGRIYASREAGACH